MEHKDGKNESQEKKQRQENVCDVSVYAWKRQAEEAKTLIRKLCKMEEGIDFVQGCKVCVGDGERAESAWRCWREGRREAERLESIKLQLDVCVSAAPLVSGLLTWRSRAASGDEVNAWHTRWEKRPLPW